MKFTLSWLKEHLETDASLEQISHRLTMLGLEVESVRAPADTFRDFIVGHVVSCKKHPDADRLKVCVVDTGDERVQVVCGAPNAHEGMKGVFAPAGSIIPGTGDELRKGVIRGVESAGMLCSEREMGLSDDHEGIIELAPDAPTGTPFAALMGLDDPVIDIGITPDRADCLGVDGIARDLAAAGLGRHMHREITEVAPTTDAAIGIALDFPAENEDACPLFLARVIRGVRNAESPAWLQNRLRAVGLRPISALVDITNFLTLDRARPLHVFDLAKIRAENGGGLTVRFARPGETLQALDGREYTLADGMTVIADDTGPLSLAGIMGGEASGCGMATVDVVLEVALFDPVRTAETGRRLGIDSDARYRFERGVDPAFARPGMELATRLILELCGGEAGPVTVAGAPPLAERTIVFHCQRVESLAGVTVPPADQRRILADLGFAIEEAGGAWRVSVPSWRHDVAGGADRVEEVVRVVGYDAIPETPLRRESSLPAAAWSAGHLRADLVRRLLATRGLMEAVTWSFMEKGAARLFADAPATLTLANPISADLDQMRPSILPNLILAAGRNLARGADGFGLFEVGPVYADDTPAGQSLAAAGLRAGAAVPRHWSEARRQVDCFDAKADALAALEAAGIPADSVQATRDAPPYYHPGRSGLLRRGPKQVLASFGELHPGVLLRLDVAGPVVAFEIHLDAIPAPKAKSGKARPPFHPSNLQAVGRDFAFVVDREVAAADVVRAATSAEKRLVRQVEVFDVYEGEHVPEGKKSLAIAVTLQPESRTFRDEEIEEISARITAAVAKATGGVLRG